MRVFLLGLIIITAIETGVYWHYDYVLHGQSASVSATIPIKAAKKANIEFETSKDKVITNEAVKLISISDNEQFVAYVGQNDELHIKDLQANNEIFSTSEEADIVYLKWIRSDSLFIGLKSPDKGLILKTLQLGSQKERTITTFGNVSPTSTFKSIIYSPYTNDVYTLIGNKNITKMYHFDTNGSLSLFPLRNSYIERPTMLSTKNDLFYEDKFNNIWLRRQDYPLKKIEGNATLLSANNDTIYYGTLNQDGRVVSIFSYKDGSKQHIYDFQTPVSGDYIIIKPDGNILYALGNMYYDVNNKKSYSIPNDSSLIVDNHKFFLITQDKTVMLKD